MIYLVYVFGLGRVTTADRPELSSMSLKRGVDFFLLGLVLLVFGGRFVVDSALELAGHFGFSGRFVGLTVLALGTSLPEMATSARRIQF